MRYLSILLLYAILLTPSLSHSQSLVEDLAIEVKETSREFSFTNKETAFYYGETNAKNKDSWQGFNVFGHEFVDDYEILIDDKMLERSSAIKAIVYPDYLKRIYPGGIVEELHVADSLALFSIRITSPKPIHLDIIPYFADGRSADEYEIQLKSETAFIARKSHLTKTEKENYPIWLAVYGEGFLPQLRSNRKGGQFSPMMMLARKATSHTITFCVGDAIAETESAAKAFAATKEQCYKVRRARMEKLLTETYVRTDDNRFNKALAWAKLSLDALMMNQVTKGIFAGLPWFNNYWGRDTFISLPGATLVQGRFTEARQILKSFAAYQQTDSTSPDYGRIPNIVTTTDKAYNTADGTPRFVIMSKEYVERSGDTTFMIEIYPTILRSIDGTLKFHCDSLGFLTHGDAETWMDAVGPDGPWSPRGNRANDIQALWAQQLEAGIWFAGQIGDVISSHMWSRYHEQLKKNFPTCFIKNGLVTDHLNADGSADRQLRPNSIFTSSLLDEAIRSRTLQSVTTGLTYNYGVASLSQNDENFHPYHQHEPFYPKDAAYHNGTVWTWLQGRLISELCHFSKEEIAAKITANSINQILDRGGVGTQSELIDAIVRPNEKEPRLSGTFSQAWNLAEFIRNFYDDYLGVNINMLRHHLVLQPKIPRSFGNIRATLNLNGRSVPIEIQRMKDSVIVLVDGKNFRKGGTAEILLADKSGEEVRTTFLIPAKSETRYVRSGKDVTLYMNGVKQSNLTNTYSKKDSPKILNSLRLAAPKLRAGLRSLKGPDYPLLTHAQIKATNPSSQKLIYADDPGGDDKGTGAFVYPMNPAFVEGSFDITHCNVNIDDKNAFFDLKFKSLSNPGWHPEYGFQLTYVAIAVDEDGVTGSGKRVVEQNANYVLDEKHAYEKLILVGGGIRLQDKDGRILAAYIPTEGDAANPLGNIENARISFALPLSILGKPSRNWTFSILTGAQDDHGGAGLGEFRTVNKEVGEWNGGGKIRPTDPNVYDILIAQP